jgi:diguanylate cyclase (GGDEF)-like protein/PAS domain S-box-containing protein
LIGTDARDALRLELRLAPAGADWRWHELQAQVGSRNSQGQARSLLLSLRDVSEHHVARERELMTAALFQNGHEALLVTDPHWRVIELNPAFADLMVTPREALVGRTVVPLSNANLRRNGLDAAEIQKRLNAGRNWAAQLDFERHDGVTRTVAVKVSPVVESGGPPRYRVVSFSDMTEALSQQAQLRRLARFDAATGLPNREEFMRLLLEARIDAARDGFKLVVCLIDLDDFARLNAEHGQAVADAVLHQVAARLQGALRGANPGSDVVARLNGDEFALLLRAKTADEAPRAVERLLALLSVPVPVRESQVGQALALEVSASLGATTYPVDDSEPETLMRHAGHALYRAKHAGRGSFQFFDPTTHQRDEAGLLALARMQRALDEGELLLHYQPQIDLRTGQLHGVEALLRWQHPERGLLAAAHFLPLIETTGLAVQIGDWVLEQAMSQCSLWLRAGQPLSVSVNVGARQLRRPDFPQRLQELLQRYPVEVDGLLHLDVLESDALSETAATQGLIQRCLSLGVGIALDDFGAGYSRLSSLKRLPVDTLKLDRAFVQGMLSDAQDLSLVESVIGLARNIGCAVLAKGVESPAHARELLRLGCRLGQGNGIAAAMPAAGLPVWLMNHTQADWGSQLADTSPPSRTARRGSDQSQGPQSP